MNRIFVISFLLVFFILTSCGTRSDISLPLSISDTGNILVVMPEYLWKGNCGDSIRKYFSQPAWGLPEPEPMFSLSQQNSLSKLMQRFRNILIINIDAGYEKSNLKIRNNVYATNQVIFDIDTPSADSIVANVYRNKDIISAYFLIKGRDALIMDYRRIVEKPIVEKLKEKFKIDIVIPRPYRLDVERENFVWISREKREQEWGILIWEEPYLRESQLEIDSLIFRMNAVTKEHVPGKLDGSYMATEPLMPPAVVKGYKEFDKDSVYYIQLNGLWQMENGFMGGPYIKQTIVDIKRLRLVTALGFAYYPQREKLQMVRQLEAILYTMTPTETNNN